MDDSKPIFARPSEKALRSRSSGVAGVQELQKWGGGHRGLQSENDADGELIERTAGREFIQQGDENDDFPTVACDLR
jgi:hypothetical protein